MKALLMPLCGLLLAVALPCAAQEAEKPKLHKDPKAALDAVFEASSKKDFKALVDSFAPEAQRRMASHFAKEGLLARQEVEGKLFKDAGKDEKLAEKFKPVLDVLDRYGLTVKATKDLDLRVFQFPKKDREALLALIKKPDAFTVEMMTAIDKVRPFPKRAVPNYTLVDLKISGDKATAKIREEPKDKGTPRQTPVEFRKVDGGWRVNPPQDEDGPKKDSEKPKDREKE